MPFIRTYRPPPFNEIAFAASTGRYDIKGPATVLDALSRLQAGGCVEGVASGAVDL